MPPVGCEAFDTVVSCGYMYLQGDFGCVDAVFEYIFNQGDEQQWCDTDFTGALVGETDVKPDGGIEPQTHQAYIVCDEVKFLLQSYGSRAVVKDETQQAAEFVDSFLRFFRRDGYEGVDGVESVEKKVRVELAFEVL